MGDRSVRDLFSARAPDYAAFRPTYPDELLDFVAALAPARRLAWDCGAGSGQAAVGLARHFRAVVATDASAAQLRSARRHPRVAYVRGVAEDCPLWPRSVDLVVAAQALHWFDRRAFFAEARRVLVDRGAIAVWAYHLVEIEPRVDAVVRGFYAEVVGPYWRPERRLVETGYGAIEFPFDEVAVPPAAIEREMTLGELAAYVGTWSATQRYREETGGDPIPDLVRDLDAAWGGPALRRRARWPIAVRAGRV
jgi:hypothetical protein